MKNTIKKLLCLTIVSMACMSDIKAGLVVSNPTEYIILTKGESDISTQEGAQIKSGAATAALQGTLVYMNDKIQSWQGKYNDYLKSASFGNALANGCVLVMDGIATMRNLYNVYVATSVNPSGGLASGLMTNLYVETASDFLSIYTTLKEVIKKGGPDNMVSGAKKAELMWQVTRLLEDFNKKLNRLSYAILCTNFTDVWNAAIAGMIDKTHEQLADEAMERWQRAIANTMRFAAFKEKHPFDI